MLVIVNICLVFDIIVDITMTVGGQEGQLPHPPTSDDMMNQIPVKHHHHH